jgi:hypothetical protein
MQFAYFYLTLSVGRFRLLLLYWGGHGTRRAYLELEGVQFVTEKICLFVHLTYLERRKYFTAAYWLN